MGFLTEPLPPDNAGRRRRATHAVAEPSRLEKLLIFTAPSGNRSVWPVRRRYIPCMHLEASPCVRVKRVGKQGAEHSQPASGWLIEAT